MNLNGRGGKGKGAPGAAPAPEPPANLAELSEKGVFNVLEIVRKEFNVDPKRTYLMGHSMGGAGPCSRARSMRRSGPRFDVDVTTRLTSALDVSINGTC